MTHDTNRRDFLKASALAGVGFWAAGRGNKALGAANDAATPPNPNPGPAVISPNDKLNIVCIGVGGKGSSDADHAGIYGNVVALCDIDDERLSAKAVKFPQAKKYNDFRKLFDEMGKSIDAVTVSTPDHTHAVIALTAIKLGKHVYCQKPLTRTVAEARAMRTMARNARVATQMGNQGTSSDGLRRGVEILRAEALGPVKDVHVWTNRPIWPQAPQVMKRPTDTPPAPAGVHWDEWIGPAPMRPWGVFPVPDKDGQPVKPRSAYHPFVWRGWLDFGTGALGDMGCHTTNMPYMGLELGYPTSIRAVGGDINDETHPSWATVVFEFPARGSKPPVTLTWWEGHKKDKKTGDLVRNIPDNKITMGLGLPESGSLCIGAKGSMLSASDYGGGLRLVFDAENGAPDFGAAPQFLPRTSAERTMNDQMHKLEWINAAKGGAPALSNFDYAGMLTEFILLGNVALRVPETKLEWDGPNMKITNNEQANALLTREYREGFKLPV